MKMAKKLPTLLDGIDGFPEPARTFVEAIAAEFPEVARLPLVHFDEFPGMQPICNAFQFDNMLLHSEDNVADPVRLQAECYAASMRESFKHEYGDPATYTRLAQVQPLKVTKTETPILTTFVLEWGIKPIIDVPKED